MGAPAFCTGILIAPGILATASLCLPSSGDAEFWPYQPIGIDARRYKIALESLVTVDGEEGWGASLVRVENLPPNQKYIPLTGTHPEDGAPVRFAGFVSDRNQFVLSLCQANQRGGLELRHLCDSGSGASGGPLLTTTATGQLKVLGIHLGNDEQGKRAFRADLIRYSPAVKAAFGDLPTD